MKRSAIVIAVLLLGIDVFAQRGLSPEAQAAARAALAKQEAAEKAAPRLQVTEEVLPLTVPNHTIGEAVGVA